MENKIDEKTKKERLARVIELQKSHTKEILLSALGKRTELLIEGVSKKNKNEMLGRTGQDEIVVVKGDESLTGQFVEVELKELRGGTFSGVIIGG